MKRVGLGRRPLLIAAVIVVTITVSAAVYACSSETQSSVEAEPSEMLSISAAVFANDRLWLLHREGSLVSLRPDEANPERATTTGRVVEICRSSGRLFALADLGANRWALQQRTADGWTAPTTVPTQGDKFVALACADDSDVIALVTNRRLVELTGVTTRSIKLKEKLQPPLVNGIALWADDAVWVGFNIGEWGGGLRRISRSDGNVETVEYNRSGDLCGGPLNTACDPVNGIVVAPWNTSCVVAAIGLVHLMPHGRIVEICGEKVRRHYFKAYDPQPPNNPLDEGEPSSTVAFFGLTRTGNTMLAVGIDGLYRFEGEQRPEFRPLPKFENKGGYWVSFDIPGVALVATDVNRRASMSGSVPIMAPR